MKKIKIQSVKLLKIIIVWIFFSFQTAFAQKPTEYFAETISSSLSYTMKNPIHSWSGDSKDFVCKIEFETKTNQIKSVFVEATILGFDSGIGKRDANAFKILEEKIFPKVSFLSDEIIENENQILVIGKLNFHGIIKTINIKATKSLQKNQLGVRGDFSVPLTDFNLKPPSLVGLKAQNNIDIKFFMNFFIK